MILVESEAWVVLAVVISKVAITWKKVDFMVMVAMVVSSTLIRDVNVLGIIVWRCFDCLIRSIKLQYEVIRISLEIKICTTRTTSGQIALALVPNMLCPKVDPHC